MTLPLPSLRDARNRICTGNCWSLSPASGLLHSSLFLETFCLNLACCSHHATRDPKPPHYSVFLCGCSLATICTSPYCNFLQTSTVHLRVSGVGCPYATTGRIGANSIFIINPVAGANRCVHSTLHAQSTLSDIRERCVCQTPDLSIPLHCCT